MNKRITSLISILLLVLLVGTFLAACGQSNTVSSNPPPATSFSGTGSNTPDGQMLLQERCTVCHSLGRITSAHKTAVQWKTTVERMVAKGAQLDAQEQQTLVDYLSQTYP